MRYVAKTETFPRDIGIWACVLLWLFECGLPEPEEITNDVKRYVDVS